MTVWATLGVPPGSDRDVIKRAYARKLRGVNPEDDPVGFQQLREAYEVATRIAQQAQWDDQWEAEEEDQPADADGAEPWPMAAEREPGADLHSVAPEEHGGPGIEPGRDREFAEFQSHLERFSALLDPSRTDHDEALLNEALTRILSSPMLAEIAVRAQLEDWMASTIAAGIPRSDAVIERAVEYFGWNSPDVLHHRSWDVAAILDRMDEWGYIRFAADPQGPLAQGWKALSDPPARSWQMRLAAFTPGTPGQVSAIFGAMGSGLGGVRFHLDQERVQWWGGYFSRARHTLGSLMLAPLLFLLTLEIASWFGPSELMMGAVMLIAAPVALAAPFAYVRLVKQRHIDWERGDRPVPPQWFSTGWMVAGGLLPLAAMLAPNTAPGAVGVLALAAAVLLWTILAQPVSLNSESFGPRGRRLFARLWLPFVLSWGPLSALVGYRYIQWFAVGAAILCAWLRAGEHVQNVVAHLVRRWHQSIAVAATVAATGLALALSAAFPGTPGYFAALCVIFCWPILVTFTNILPEANKLPIVLCWVALGFYLLTATGEENLLHPAAPPSEAAKTVPLEPAQPGEPQVRATSPTDRPETQLVSLPPLARPKPVPKPPVCRERSAEELAGPAPLEPCGDPTSWMVPGDYPEKAMRANAQGTSIVVMDIDADGRVTDCTVQTSSGTPELDEATCSIMSERGRFLPARTPDGEAVPSKFRFTLTWELN